MMPAADRQMALGFNDSRATARLIPVIPGGDAPLAQFPSSLRARVQPTLQSSYSAKAGYPVRRGFSARLHLPLEYWIIRFRG